MLIHYLLIDSSYVKIFTFQVRLLKHIVKLKEITKPIHDDLNCVDKVIKSHLSSDIPVINQISTYILNSGGKENAPNFPLTLSRSRWKNN